jgi:PleD family two-component response regulator
LQNVLTRFRVSDRLRDVNCPGDSILKDNANIQPTNSSSRVLIVEDHEDFRRFIRAALEQRADFQVVGEASDGLEAVQSAEELQPDLVLLDRPAEAEWIRSRTANT